MCKKIRRLIAIDTGTSRTRVCLVEGGKRCLAQFQSDVGVRNTAIHGTNGELKQTVHDGIQQVLRESGLSICQIDAVYAGGMITSNMGFVEIPHLLAPVGLGELAAGVRTVSLPDVCDLPIHFVPGVKNNVSTADIQSCGKMDMMRGEELETMALLSRLPKGKAYLFVLPGSHTKFVSVDKRGKITGCLTTLSGEMLAALTCNTVLTDAVQGRFVEPKQYCGDLVLAGYREASKNGLGRAAFSVRILSQHGLVDSVGAANYLLGAVLQEDVRALKSMQDSLCVDSSCEMIISGKFTFQQALKEIFIHSGLFPIVREFTLQGELSLSALGTWLVAQKAVEDCSENTGDTIPEC